MIINRREAVGNVNGLAKTCSEPSVFRSAKEPKEVRESVFMRYGEGIAAAVCGVLTLVAWLGESRLGWVSTLLYLLAYAVGGYAKGKEGILTLSQERKLDVNLLMIIAALGSAITSPMVSPVAQVVPKERHVHDQLLPDHALHVLEKGDLILKPDDSQILAEACRRWVGRPLRAPKRIISRPL